MLTVEHLRKSYYFRPVLQDISFKVEASESVGILGKNGAGKTTLLRVLARISARDGGDARLDGRSLFSSSPSSRAGMLFLGHQPNLYPVLTGEENLRLITRLYGHTQMNGAILDALEQVGLGRFRWDPIRNYSRGMLQRLGLAKALVLPWKLLLLDEPTTGLDEEGMDLLEEFILRWQGEKRSMIIVSHQHSWLERSCSRIFNLENGILTEISPASRPDESDSYQEED